MSEQNQPGQSAVKFEISNLRRAGPGNASACPGPPGGIIGGPPREQLLPREISAFSRDRKAGVRAEREKEETEQQPLRAVGEPNARMAKAGAEAAGGKAAATGCP